MADTDQRPEIAEITEAPEMAEAAQPVRAGLNRKVQDIFRSLWTSIFYSGRTAGKSVLVCSADRQEGASTVAAGLALAGSEPVGVARVALVDFNLRDAALHKMLKAAQAPGVCEIVVDGAEPASVAQSIGAGLDFYAIGNADGRALNVLRSDALPGLFNTLSSSYDYVIVDVAAANHFPDAQVLAGIVKDVVMVAHTDQTPREAVAQAKKRIEAGGGRIAGLVLNLRTFPIPRFLYRRV
ncbi:MAG: CpsD/CapB family tyrosine-protein kinase [Phycisphaerae bacterium]|nr:CpsD/CapB family tyrosine-protein kinase [Phycisphaerae bacterium]